jgi:glycosyltransferase involved in cell wall biosynthesis
MTVSAPRPGLRTRLRRWTMRRVVRAFMLVYAGATAFAGFIGRRPRAIPAEGADILLTGAFYSNNWIHSHLLPLARSGRCRRLRVVSTFQIDPLPKVELITPPRWLRKIAGDTGARLLTFVGVSIRSRPDIVGGFHLLINGLLAAFVGKLVGARSLYFCVGGPAEVLDGGLSSENRLFERLEVPDPVVERRLLRALDRFDWIITMGTRARRFFADRGVRASCHVISGGLNAVRYFPATAPARFDFIFVGRLVPIKRVDLFLDAIRQIADTRPEVSAVVVGDGKEMPVLRAQAERLGLAQNVQFVGQQSDIERWLRDARVFVMTSDSEGLSLALIEAMLCGLPAVVSDVGDLGDLVENGVNGYLVPERGASAFATRMLELVRDEPRRAELSRAARQGAERFELGACVQLWDRTLALPAAIDKA